MNKYAKNIILLLVLAIIIFMIVQFVGKGKEQSIPYSEFVTRLQNNEFSLVRIEDDKAIGFFDKHGKKQVFTIRGMLEDEIRKIILAKKDQKIQLHIKERDKDGIWKGILVQVLVIIVMGVIIWFLFIRQLQGAGNKAFSFGKSRAKLVDENRKKKITFEDVAGVDEAKEELKEIIDFLMDPKKFETLGARLPRGVILVGPPGTGKTLLARAVAGEADVPFYSISGSDFVEMFVGVGASRVRDLFEQGKRTAPCIIFIDEIDAVGRQRGAGLGGGHDEREQTLNQLLVEMDGFDTNAGVILMAATNRPDVLDTALLRPGRFDRQVVIDIPDVKGREGILKIHSSKVPLAAKVDLKTIAKATPGFSGADLANLINEAALLAARYDRKKVSTMDMEDAKDKVMMGAARKSMVISNEEKYKTAIHEAGHAVVTKLHPNSNALHKVTIIPRGRALGVTHHLVNDEKKTYDKDYYLTQLKVLLGGRAAEELVFNEITTGASNDLQRVTEIARKMVCSWGMSDVLGPITFGEDREQIFLGREISQHRDYSEDTAKLIDKEVKTIIVNAYSDTQKKLKQFLPVLKEVADMLCERETLEADVIEEVLEKYRESKSRRKPIQEKEA